MRGRALIVDWGFDVQIIQRCRNIEGRKMATDRLHFFPLYFYLPPDEAKSIEPEKLTSVFNIKLMAISRRRARRDDSGLTIVMAGETGMFHPRYLDASPHLDRGPWLRDLTFLEPRRRNEVVEHRRATEIVRQPIDRCLGLHYVHFFSIATRPDGQTWSSRRATSGTARAHSPDATSPQSKPKPSAADATHVGGLPASHRSAPAKKPPLTKGRHGSTHPNEPSSSNSRSQPSSRSNSTSEEISTGYDRYEECEEIGRGGCGIVLRAWDRQLLREVVIKRVLGQSEYSAEAQSRFLNEARITGQLEHPGIVPVHEIGRHPEDGRPFYVMKWLQGTTLSTALREYHAMQPSREKDRRFRELLVRYHQVCQTLAYAHQQGVIHRDLKPANVMLGNSVKPLFWIGDSPRRSKNVLTKDQRLINRSKKRRQAMCRPTNPTRSIKRNKEPSWGRPPICPRNKPEVNYQGRNAFRCLLARNPALRNRLRRFSLSSSNNTRDTQFGRSSGLQAASKTQAQHARALAAIVDRSLQRDPEDRYPTAAELANDIESYLAGDSVSAFPEPWWLRMDRVIGKHQAVFRIAFVALVAISTVALLSVATIHRSREAERQAKQLAQHESAQKAQALEGEQRAHYQSNLQLKAARNAVDTWLVDLSGDLQFYPGLASLRGELLTRAKDYYASLSKAPIESASIELEVAKPTFAWAIFCDLRVSGKTHGYNINSPMNDCSKSRSQQRSLRGSSRSTSERSDRHHSLDVRLLAAIEEDFTSIEQSIEQAREYAAKARQGAPEDREAANAEARANLVRARLFAKALRWPEAIASLNESLKFAEMLASDNMGTREQSLLASISTISTKPTEATEISKHPSERPAVWSSITRLC